MSTQRAVPLHTFMQTHHYSDTGTGGNLRLNEVGEVLARCMNEAWTGWHPIGLSMH